MSIIGKEFSFLMALWRANLLAAMEYRIAFLSQAAGMFINNAIYFIFWIIFFNRFEEIQGWGLNDMMLLFGIVASSIGLANFLFGNIQSLSEVIATGRLDYYLSLPRPILIHVLASNSLPAGLGDVLYGLTSFVASGYFTIDALARFVLGVLFATLIIISIMIIAHSAAFWMGHADQLGSRTFGALMNFALYPMTLFDGLTKFLLFTILPSALIGAMPMEFVRAFTWGLLAQMVGAGLLFLTMAIIIFHRGLRRYESGSAIQIQA